MSERASVVFKRFGSTIASLRKNGKGYSQIAFLVKRKGLWTPDFNTKKKAVLTADELICIAEEINRLNS